MTFVSFGHRCMRVVAAVGIFFEVNAMLVSGFNGTCKQKPGIDVPAFTQWPFGVNCDHLVKEWSDSGQANSADKFKCSVYYNGSMRVDRLFELTGLKDDNLYKIELVINDILCLSSDVTIDLRSFPIDSCVESIDKNMRYKSSTMEDHVKLDCEPTAGSPDIIPKGANRNNFKTTWITNCKDSRYRENNGWDNVRPLVETNPDSLDMSRVDFYDAVNFTCKVAYGSRSMYIITYAQCIQQKTDENPPSITCTKNETAAKGENAEFDCVGQMVFGTTKSDNLRIQWKKNGKIICENIFFGQNVAGINERFSCITNDESNNASLQCVTDVPAENDVQPSRKKIDMRFSISNVQSEDFGSDYSITFGVRNEKGNWQNVDEQNMALLEDLTPTIRMIIIILASLLGALMLMLIVAFVVYQKRIYILLWYKRMWMKYDKDDKIYVAYLSYLYNGDSESKSDQATKKIVFAIQSVMEELEYRYYDEQREGNFEPIVEKITNLVENSHRMVIVLTEEYLEDQWRRFHAELGFHGLLESRMGLIFILTPGVKKALVKRAKTDKVWEKLLIALKGNGQSIIKWKERMSEDELKKHIEYALPMLARKQRTLSTVSDGEVSFKKGVGYERSVSEMTTCTIASRDTVPAII